MSEEKTEAKSKRRIGGIRSPYGSFGSENGEGEESETAVRASERPAVQNAKNLEVQTSTLPESENVSMPEAQTSSISNVKKSKHPEWKQKTIYLPPQLAHWLNVHAADVELEISEIVAMALREYKERHP